MPAIPSAIPSARLLLPRPALSACLFMGVERDTRGTVLTDAERFNHYPASPLAGISWIFQGALRMVETEGAEGAQPPQLGPCLPRMVISGPQRRPVTSWSPGPVHALTVAFRPEALARLTGIAVDALLDRHAPLEEVVSGPMLAACRDVLDAGGADPFAVLEDRLSPLWADGRGGACAPTLADWLRSLAMQAAFSKAGRGARQMQRRIKGWTGHSQRDLGLFARVEAVGRHVWGNRPHGEAPDLAGVAASAGYADQSHMGREVRRVTGLPPGRLDHRMAHDEAFWFYRLIGAWYAGR